MSQIERALCIAEKIFGQDSTKVAGLLQNMAVIFLIIKASTLKR